MAVFLFGETIPAHQVVPESVFPIESGRIYQFLFRLDLIFIRIVSRGLPSVACIECREWSPVLP